MSKSSELIRLEASQIDQAANVLARAFQDDPMMNYIIPDDSKRAQVLPWYLSTIVRYCFLYGEVYSTVDLAGVVCSLPPQNTILTLPRMIRAGMMVEPIKLGWAGFCRLNMFVTYTDEIEERFAPGPHWYFWLLGVEPAVQRKGIGGRLIRRLLARADSDELPGYLETMNERNVPLYEKYGFHLVYEGTVPRSQLRVYAMLREPYMQTSSTE